MNINELTLGEIKEISKLVGCDTTDNSAWDIGKQYFIRTVTFSYVGKLIKVTKNELVLDKVSWIADSGRFQPALSEGVEKQSSAEIELFPKPVIIGRGAIIDAVEYVPALPEKQK
jgi:hypothetical protein